MHNPALGLKLAVLVANGFCEDDFVSMQKIVQPMGISMRVVSVENGLVNSWSGSGWGLNFASDNSLAQALSSDYDMLFIPGGAKSYEKLKLTAHSKRFVKGFMECMKPVMVSGDAMKLMEFCEMLEDKDVSMDENAYQMDANLFIMRNASGLEEAGASAMKDFLSSFDMQQEPLSQAA